MLERHAPRRPSFVFLSARHSTDAGAAFLHAGVPAVVCLRGYLPEEAIGEFTHEFYRHLLEGTRSRSLTRRPRPSPMSISGRL